jgi:hypothetical protein
MGDNSEDLYSLRVLPPMTRLGHWLCSVLKRRSVVGFNQREDLLGRVHAAHDMVAE